MDLAVYGCRTLKRTLNCDIPLGEMKFSPYNLGRYTRLSLLLLLLTAQGIAVAHDLGDSHGLMSHPCSTCIIGHGLGTAVSFSYQTPPLQVYRTLTPIHSTTAILASRVNCHCARAPPISSWNTQNPN